MGGEILFIEATMMPGAGRLSITGQLGDVMKESAQIALSLARSKFKTSCLILILRKKTFTFMCLRALFPKDGPSAGVAMLTTVASLFFRKASEP